MLSNVLLSFVQPKAWQIDLTCAIDFTPSPHKKKKKEKKKQPEKALQTRFFVGCFNTFCCLSSSPNMFSIAVKIARYLVYKVSLQGVHYIVP